MYGDKVTLLYTDTDSLIIEIKSENVFVDIKNNSDWFDTSNYEKENIYGIVKSISKLGKMKDEFGGKVPHSFYGLMTKTYAIKSNLLDKSEKKKPKGVSKNVVDKELTFEHNKRIVDDGGQINRKMYVFKSSLHTVYTELKNKVALSSTDDKRFVIQGNPNTLAWGYKSVLDNKDISDKLLELLIKTGLDLMDNTESNEEY